MESKVAHCNHVLKLIILFLAISPFCSCKKYLDAKPDKKLVVPMTVQDLQGILDYYSYMNIVCSDAGEIASDNYYLPDDVFHALPTDGNRNAYLWKAGIFIGASNNDWINEYNIVYNSNIVLEGLQKISKDSFNSTSWDNCKGMALVFRGKAFYEIAQIWAKAYDSSTANSDLGIPLRLNSDFNEISIRANLNDTYNQIINDFKQSIPLLSRAPPLHLYRPYKAAAYGLLSRIFLTMGDYINAKLFADSCLQLNNNILDYNTLNSGSAYPFSGIQFSNPEDIMHTVCAGANSRNIKSSRGKIDSLLYQSYNVNDLRKTIFFKSNGDGTYYFDGSYDGGSTLNYNGVATDEIILIRAECYARQGNAISAMIDLNSLLVKRWKTGSFIPFTTSDPAVALNIILNERRKELVYRMLRFTDLKRLNKKGSNITLKRVVNGQIFTLLPNDPRYALPIPDDVIQYSGMQQN